MIDRLLTPSLAYTALALVATGVALKVVAKQARKHGGEDAELERIFEAWRHGK